MEMGNRYPVALFAFRRAELLGIALEALREAGVPRIYAYVDGARGPADEPGRSAVLGMLENIRWAPVTVVARQANAGINGAVRSGLDDFFSREPAGVVVEEDIRLVEGAYAWMCEALDRYGDDPRVGAIGAGSHLRLVPPDVTGPWFGTRAPGWGWATWRRAWALVQEPVDALLARLEREGFDAASSGDDVIALARVGYWDAHFALACYGARLLVLNPPRNLTDHLGFGEHATTQRVAGQWRTTPAAPIAERWEWPARLEAHPESAPLNRLAALAHLHPWKRQPQPDLRRQLSAALRRFACALPRGLGRVRLRLADAALRLRTRVSSRSDPAVPWWMSAAWDAFLIENFDAFFGCGLAVGSTQALTAIGGAQMQRVEVVDGCAWWQAGVRCSLDSVRTLSDAAYHVVVAPVFSSRCDDLREAIWHGLRVTRAEGTLFMALAGDGGGRTSRTDARQPESHATFTQRHIHALLEELGAGGVFVQVTAFHGTREIADFVLDVVAEMAPTETRDAVSGESVLTCVRVTKPVHWTPRWRPPAS